MARVTIEDLTDAQLRAITAALTVAGVAHETSRLVWTSDEARSLLFELSGGQSRLLRLLVEWDGVLTADVLRDSVDGTLRGGTTGPITKAIERMATAGQIRRGLPAPATAVYDPNIRGRQRVRAYRMDGATLEAFRAAIDLIDGEA